MNKKDKFHIIDLLFCLSYIGNMHRYTNDYTACSMIIDICKKHIDKLEKAREKYEKSVREDRKV